jgi:hypothetical protein
MTPTSFSRPVSEPLNRLPIGSELTFQASLTQKSSNFGLWNPNTALQELAAQLNNRLNAVRNMVFSNPSLQSRAPMFPNFSHLISPLSNANFKTYGSCPVNFPMIPNSFSMKQPLFNPYSSQTRSLIMNNPLFNQQAQTEQPLTVQDQSQNEVDFSLPSKQRGDLKIFPEHAVPAQKKIKSKPQEKAK